MKKEIHPKYHQVFVNCSCGRKMNIFSTLKKKNLTLEICSNCHPFYTGKQRVLNNRGRIERFNKRFL